MAKSSPKSEATTAADAPTKKSVDAAMIQVLKAHGSTSAGTAMFLDELVLGVETLFPGASHKVILRLIFSILADAEHGANKHFKFGQFDMIYV